PFDSHKFIQKCRELIEQGSTGLLSEAEEASLDFEDEETSDWVMDAPKPQADDQEFSPDMRDDQDTWDEDTSPGITIGDAEILSSPESKLDEELQGWGVSIPDPINKGQVAMGEIPPVIDESEEDFSDHQSTVLAIKEDEETVYPD